MSKRSPENAGPDGAVVGDSGLLTEARKGMPLSDYTLLVLVALRNATQRVGRPVSLGEIMADSHAQKVGRAVTVARLGELLELRRIATINGGAYGLAASARNLEVRLEARSGLLSICAGMYRVNDLPENVLAELQTGPTSRQPVVDDRQVVTAVTPKAPVPSLPTVTDDGLRVLAALQNVTTKQEEGTTCFVGPAKAGTLGRDPNCEGLDSSRVYHVLMTLEALGLVQGEQDDKFVGRLYRLGKQSAFQYIKDKSSREPAPGMAYGENYTVEDLPRLPGTVFMEQTSGICEFQLPTRPEAPLLAKDDNEDELPELTTEEVLVLWGLVAASLGDSENFKPVTAGEILGTGVEFYLDSTTVDEALVKLSSSGLAIRKPRTGCYLPTPLEDFRYRVTRKLAVLRGIADGDACRLSEVAQTIKDGMI